MIFKSADFVTTYRATPWEPLKYVQASYAHPDNTKDCMTIRTIPPENWFSTKGRINRSTFLIRTTILIACYVGSIGIVAKSGGPVLLAWALSTAAFVVYLLQAVKRGHDFGANGWALLLSIVPVVNVVWLLVMVCVPGSPNDNRYGPAVKVPEGGPQGGPEGIPLTLWRVSVSGRGLWL